MNCDLINYEVAEEWYLDIINKVKKNEPNLDKSLGQLSYIFRHCNDFIANTNVREYGEVLQENLSQLSLRLSDRNTFRIPQTDHMELFHIASSN
jgi:hypothetical protein